MSPGAEVQLGRNIPASVICLDAHDLHSRYPGPVYCSVLPARDRPVVDPKPEACIPRDIKEYVKSGNGPGRAGPPDRDVRKGASNIEVCQAGLQPRGHVHAK